MRTISLLSVSTISRGVRAGAANPNHPDASNPGSAASAMVGKSGNCAERFAVVTASARSRPAFTCGNAVGIASNIACTCPAMMSMCASGLDLYAMCSIVIPDIDLNSSPERWIEPPAPEDA